MYKALGKADKYTKMISTGNQYYLIKKDNDKEKIIPAATFANDVDELGSKEFAQRYNEQVEKSKKLYDKDKEKEIEKLIERYGKERVKSLLNN